MTLATSVLLHHITPQLAGAAVTVFPADASLTLEIWRAPDNGSGAPNDAAAVSVAVVPPMPLSGGTYFDSLPSDGNTYYYKARHPAQPGWAAGSFCAYSNGVTAQVAGGQQSGFTFEAFKPARTYRGLPMADGNYALQANDTAGTVAPSPTVQTDGMSGRTLAKGVLVGTATHTAAVTFGLSYQNTPEVKFQGGISYEPRNAQWSGGVNAALPQYDDFAALNATASGFTVQARLRQKAAPTARAAQYGAGNAATSIGATVNSNALANAPSNTNNYTTQYNVSLTPTLNNKGQQITLTLAIDAKLSSAGSFTQYATINYSFTPTPNSTLGQTWTGESQTISVGSVTATGVIRLRIVNITGPWSTASVHGWVSGTDGGDGVDYYTATDSFASKTPDAGDVVTWWAKAIT